MDAVRRLYCSRPCALCQHDDHDDDKGRRKTNHEDAHEVDDDGDERLEHLDKAHFERDVGQVGKHEAGREERADRDNVAQVAVPRHVDPVEAVEEVREAAQEPRAQRGVGQVQSRERHWAADSR